MINRIVFEKIFPDETLVMVLYDETEGLYSYYFKDYTPKKGGSDPFEFAFACADLFSDDHIKNLWDSGFFRNDSKWYWVACRETGEKIECFRTIEEAKNRITQFEEEDKKDGSFTPDFYDIVDDDFMHIDF